MSAQKDWLKFIISGSVSDYLKYIDSCRKENLNGDGNNAFFDRCSGDTRNEYRG